MLAECVWVREVQFVFGFWCRLRQSLLCTDSRRLRSRALPSLPCRAFIWLPAGVPLLSGVAGDELFLCPPPMEERLRQEQ